MGCEDGRNYLSRAYVIKKLGYKSYKDYMQSDLWKRVRALVLEVKGNKCELCGKSAESVHHERYAEDDLTGERLRFLHPICDHCHTKIHREHNVVVPLTRTRKLFRAMRKRFLREQERCSYRQHLINVLGYFNATDSNQLADVGL